MKNLVLIFSLLVFTMAHASLPEYFGASSTSAALGNQAHGNRAQADSNYSAAALLGWDKRISYSFNSFTIDTDFTAIRNVVVRNEYNSDNAGTEYGNVNTEMSTVTMLGGHIALPLFGAKGPMLGISFFAPVDKLVESSTGDPYTPEYVMYRSRYSRPTFMVNGIYALNDKWSVAVGGYSGFQVTGETYFIARTNGDDTAGGDQKPSAGKIKFNGKPSLSGVASLARKWENSTSYLSWQQRMKSRFTTQASGITPVGGSGLPFDLKMDALAYYDPLIFRLGHLQNFGEHKLALSLEWQQWDSYASPKLRLGHENGVIVSGQDFENLGTRNIFVPKIGWQQQLSDTWQWRAGYAYRPSPLRRGHLEEAGNSVDADTHIVSTGLGLNYPVWDVPFELAIAYQWHKLQEYRVNKLNQLENGEAGSQIGYPGYRVGGQIHVLSMGVSWSI